VRTTVSNAHAPLAVLSLREQVEEYLDGLVYSRAASTQLLGDAMRYGLTAAGQRLRPVMALATADMLGRPPASLLPFAAALEMIHTHGLIHADLPAVCDNHLRDAKPTVHIVFGERIALLAGDALLAEALTLILREQAGEPARVLAASAQLMNEASAGLLGGLHAGRPRTQDLDDDELRAVYELQTDHLLAFAVGGVLILTGESGPVAAAVGRFGAAVGVLSEIVDDILGATGQDGVRGTPRHRDAHDGKSTYVSTFGLKRARELARASHGHATAALAEVQRDTAVLQSLADFVLARGGPASSRKGQRAPRRDGARGANS
jgi:geranylgeranyl diphosphate synthase type II